LVCSVIRNAGLYSAWAAVLGSIEEVCGGTESLRPMATIAARCKRPVCAPGLAREEATTPATTLEAMCLFYQSGHISQRKEASCGRAAQTQRRFPKPAVSPKSMSADGGFPQQIFARVHQMTNGYKSVSNNFWALVPAA